MYFHYALKDEKDPMSQYNKILEEVEANMDPASQVKIDELPNKDWLRST